MTRFPRNAGEAARGSIAVAEAKAFASDTAVEVASDCSRWPGRAQPTSVRPVQALAERPTHASHDPVDWKDHHVGNYLLNDALPPNHGQL